jgi:uncharacterized membrane protein
MNLSRTAIAMSIAGLTVFVIGILTTKPQLAAAHGLEKIVALNRVCFAIPLAVFGALHLFGPEFIEPLVPKYMPVRMFWVYGIGCALVAAGMSIAAGRVVRWSAFLFGTMMFMFVLMLYLPGALRHPDNRMGFTIVFRETSFGAGAWLLAATVSDAWPDKWRRVLLLVGRVLVLPALVMFGVEHFLHPALLPGVPLTRDLPAWVPGKVVIDYITGAALLAVAASVVLRKNTRQVATWVGGWLLFLIVVIYGPVMIGALTYPEVAAQVEGINYFADTLLFAGVILAVAKSTQRQLEPAIGVMAQV